MFQLQSAESSAICTVAFLQRTKEKSKRRKLYAIEKKAEEVVGQTASTTSSDCKAGSAAGSTVLNIIGVGAAPETGGVPRT
jgi:hypothetical protein